MNCRICFSNRLDLVFDLGEQPWGNNFLRKDQLGKEKFYPLQLLYCNACSLPQLSYTVKKEIMFSDHTYLSGSTKSLSMHFKTISEDLNKKFNKKKLNKNILDIGSNDGTFLKHFKELGWKVLGIESSKRISEIANKSGIKTINKFFNLQVADEIGYKFDFINASGVFFHLDELHSVTKGIKKILTEDGVFVVQFLYMKQIIKNIAFDQIYHEHLIYYNLKTLQNLLDIYNLEIFDANLADIHGGQMTAYVGHKKFYEKKSNYKKLLKEENKSNCNKKIAYLEFSKQANNLKKKNLEYIGNSLSNNKIIFGMGAPVKGNTLLNFFKLNSSHIKKLLEINFLRKNLFAPGSHIPIELEQENKEVPDIFYVLAWNFKNEILLKNKKMIDNGIEFFFPIEIK